ncbi:unnamed protein product [marine sediment metagenome]|uniref:Uncharacterized protein n=1 Tax=marine sediment metagenome TaxID=412755 RepID=X1H7T6_9ZZZZ
MEKTMLKTTERYPNLQTVLMVEKFIEKNSGEYKKTELFNKLPKKMMWNTFQTIMSYLESINKIIIEKDKKVVYIWNPDLYNKIKNRPDIQI